MPETPDAGLEWMAPVTPGPWGPGGLEVELHAEDQPAVVEFLLSLGVRKTPAKNLARYLCTFSEFADEGGPPDAAAIGRALDLRDRAVYDILDPGRSNWSAKAVRHRAALAALARPFDGVIVSHCFTTYERPKRWIVLAHAFSSQFRIVIAAARVSLDDPELTEKVVLAHRDVVIEIANLLRRLDLPEPVPVLVTSPYVGQATLPRLVETDIAYLIELASSWSAGGIVPADILDDPTIADRFGGSLRGLFPVGSRPAGQDVAVRPVVLGTFSPALGNWAVAHGAGDAERFFIGRAPDAADDEYGDLVADFARRWSAENLEAGVERNYGLERLHAPKDDPFQRHVTALAVRDAFIHRRLA